MFFMFSLFSLFSPHADTTQQKKPQEIAPLVHCAHAAVPASPALREAEPVMAQSYNLNEPIHEQIVVPQTVAQQAVAVSLTPIMPTSPLPTAVSAPIQIPVTPVPVAPPPVIIPQAPPIVINNYTTCSPSAVSSNQIETNNSMSAQVSANMSAYMEQAQQMLHEELPHQMVTLQALLWEYRYHIAGGSVMVTYVALCYSLYKAMHYLSYKTVWSSWHKELSMEELLTQDVTVLGKSLIIAIQMRYANPQNPTDFIAPLVAFNIQIQQEIEELRSHWRLYVFCRDWRLIKIVPFSVDQLNALKEHIERAAYVQTVFKTWTANYNFVQNVRVQIA